MDRALAAYIVIAIIAACVAGSVAYVRFNSWRRKSDRRRARSEDAFRKAWKNGDPD